MRRDLTGRTKKMMNQKKGRMDGNQMNELKGESRETKKREEKI